MKTPISCHCEDPAPAVGAGDKATSTLSGDCFPSPGMTKSGIDYFHASLCCPPAWEFKRNLRLRPFYTLKNALEFGYLNPKQWTRQDLIARYFVPPQEQLDFCHVDPPVF